MPNASPVRVVVAIHEQRIREVELFLVARGDLEQRVQFAAVSEDGVVDREFATRAEVFWRSVSNATPWMATVIDQLPALKWFHTDSVGVDTLPLDEIVRREVVLTNGVGLYSRPMAEWVVLGLLAAVKRLPDFVRQSDRGEWFTGAPLRELDGAVVLLVGLGSVNALVARMLEPFNVDVRAVVRRAASQLEPGVRAAVPFSGLKEELASADFVVLGLPLTRATAGMVGAEALARMKPGAWLVNISRGGLVDETALMAALDSGHIGGAVLDTFATEPLPLAHPLWRRRNVVVIPHFSGSSRAVTARRNELFLDQLAAWLVGAPLRNIVDPVDSY